MTEIKALGYVGFEVADLAAWRGFAVDLLGLDGDQWDADGGRLRLDSYDWRIGLTKGPRDDLAYVGWEVADAADLDALEKRLSGAGIDVQRGTRDACEQRGVLGLITFIALGGLASEAFYGPTIRSERPYYPRQPISGYVTGEQGLGHVILNSDDPEALVAFYVDVLGFRVTDLIKFSPLPGFSVELTFLRCNSRHHSLAIGRIPMPKAMQHFMLQLTSVDDVGALYYRAQDLGHPITLTLGRHSNDQMLSFYVATPSGFDLEVGWGAIDVDDATWHVQLHRHQSAWGHRPGPGLRLPPG